MERTLKDPLRPDHLHSNLQNTDKLTKWSVEPFLLSHEFLYILCNTEDRLNVIKRTHTCDLVSAKGNINHWELPDPSTGKHRISHFDLLSKNAFTN